MFKFFSRKDEISGKRGDKDDFVIVKGPTSPPRDMIPDVFQLAKCCNLDLNEITVDEIQHQLSSGGLTSVQYTKVCLENIRKANPYLECVIETNPDAISIAVTLDQERKDGRTRGPLHGIPVLVKDNMATADKMETTAGSFALLGGKVPKDAHIVHLLRKAGAIILGKTNLDEWAGMRSNDYSWAYSARGGQCRNPFDLTKTPHGSSSGSAVSVSANLVPLSFGTETDCSIITPATVNGVVGLKPTVGLTSRAGAVPASETQDSIGPFGRTVADCARALDVVAGMDEEDKFSTVSDRRQMRSYHDCLVDRTALKKARFGLPMKRFWEAAPEPQRKVVERVLKLIRQSGAKIIEVDMPCAEERLQENGEWDWERHHDTNPEKSEFTVITTQIYKGVNEYLSRLENTPIRSLEDIVKYNKQNCGSEGGYPGYHPAFPDGQPVLEQCVATKGVQGPVYHAALQHITSQCRDNGIDAALRCPDASDGGEAQLDALLFCDIKRSGIQIAAQAGYPVITIPVGLDPDGMPVSLVLIHSQWQEDKLLRWASAIEDLMKHTNDVRIKANGGKQLSRRKRLGRISPTYKNHLRKNIPLEMPYRYSEHSDKVYDSSPDRAASFDQYGQNEDLEEWETPSYLV